MSPSLTMVKVTYGPAIRAVILLILLVVFFYLFFWQVVTQYLEKLTNTAKIVQKSEVVEVPTFTICSGWKKISVERIPSIPYSV